MKDIFFPLLLLTVPDALWDFVSLGMRCSLFSRSLSELDSTSDQGFLFFTFFAEPDFDAGVLLGLAAPVAQQTNNNVFFFF